MADWTISSPFYLLSLEPGELAVFTWNFFGLLRIRDVLPRLPARYLLILMNESQTAHITVQKENNSANNI